MYSCSFNSALQELIQTLHQRLNAFLMKVRFLLSLKHERVYLYWHPQIKQTVFHFNDMKKLIVDDFHKYIFTGERRRHKLILVCFNLSCSYKQSSSWIHVDCLRGLFYRNNLVFCIYMKQLFVITLTWIEIDLPNW